MQDSTLRNDFPYRRILVIGCGGAGKSVLSRKLGEKFSIPVIHLDKMWWLPNWTTRTQEEFDEMLLKELEKPAWIMDGNFRRTFEFRLKYADFCIFLDLDSETCLKSVYARVEEFRGKSRPDMTEGCIERVDEEFESWVRNYNTEVRPETLETLKNSNVPYRIFTSRENAEQWLNNFN